MKSLVINRPDLQKMRNRYGYGLVTFIFWVLWFYLWLPLISLAAWSMGFNLFYDEMVVAGGFNALLDLLVFYLLVILLISLTLGVWAIVSLFRFRGKNRRREREVVNDEALASFFNVESENLSKWRSSKRMVISHGEDATIKNIKV